MESFNDPEITLLRDDITRQLTTFDHGRRTKTIPLRRGTTVTVGEVKGCGTIAQLWLTFPGWFWQHWDPGAPISQTILKTVFLNIYWDQATQPAVRAPVGDFFGNGLCEYRNFGSRYFGMSSGGFYCRFPMPFRTGFRVELENNDEGIDTEIFLNILYQLKAISPESGYFHAQFHTAHNTGSESVEILKAEGRGRYVGCTLALQGDERNYLSFLEAPEYVYLDGESSTPSIVGTGMEDYFLGGWYFREGEFIGELHGVVVKDTLNSSVAMYRVQIDDSVHFRKKMEMRFENPWDPARLRPFTWSSIAYYYLDSSEGLPLTRWNSRELLLWRRCRNTDHQSIP